MSLTDEQIVNLVNAEFSTAIGNPGGQLSRERADAIDYYLSKPFGDDDEDDDSRSKVVTSDVSDAVDGIMPTLLRIFTTADNIVSFDATGVEDEEQAEQESAYISHIFFNRNESFEILFFSMFDALLKKTGIIKAWWDDAEEITTETYEGLSEDEFLSFMEDDELALEKSTTRKAETIDEVSGQIVNADVRDVTFIRTNKVGRVRVECVPPDEYRISKDSRSLNPSGARMVGHEREVTRDELLEMGFDEKLIRELEPAPLDNSTERQARKDKTDDNRDRPKSPDKSQDIFVLREAYMKIDADQDGRAELMQIFSVGEKLLAKERADRQPFHMLCPQPLPHKHVGRSSAERVMDVQRVTSVLLRQVLDNLYQTNNPGHAVWEQGLGDTTMSDLLTRQVGSVTRFRRPIPESYAPMKVEFTAGQTFPMLEYFEKVKRDRTGINSDAEGLTPDALKHIQTTVLAQAVDMSRMKIEMIARIFAETGFKSLFRHLRELVRKHQTKVDIFKLRGVYVKVKPTDWRERKDMTVHVGLGIGTREQNLMHLESIWDKQKQMAEGGGMNLTVTPKNFFNTAAEIVKNANLKEPGIFFTDPGSQQAPPPSDERQQLEQMQVQLQQRQQQLDEQRQQLDIAKLNLERERDQFKRRHEMQELERKREKDRDDFFLQFEELKNKLTEMELKFSADVPGSRV